jgi:hypothetical protein
MKLNKRGSLGFPEAIMAAMIVTLVLTMYMGMFCLNAAEQNSDPEVNIDHRIFEVLVLEDKKITGDIEHQLRSESERHGYRGISFTCEVPGEFGFEDRHDLIGDMDGNISSDRFPFSLRSADGRTIPVIIEVAVCV